MLSVKLSMQFNALLCFAAILMKKLIEEKFSSIGFFASIGRIIVHRTAREVRRCQVSGEFFTAPFKFYLQIRLGCGNVI